MFNIDRELFSMVGISPTIYKRGKEYYELGRVISVKYDAVNNQFLGKVTGENEYKVALEFDDYDFIDAQCTCPAFKGYRSYCKHIVAMLLSVEKMSRSSRTNRNSKTNHIEEKKQMEGIEALLDFYNLNSSRKNPHAISLQMKIDCQIRWCMTGIGKGIWRVLFSLRLGEKTLYRVKDVKQLLNSIENKSPLSFGKLFNFNPNMHQFKEDDQTIIDYLIELMDHEKKIMEEVYGDFNSFFKGKEIALSPTGIKKIFTLLKGKQLDVELNDTLYENIPVVEEDLPCKIRLEEEGGNFHLKLEEESFFTPLVPSGEIYFIKDKIYIASRQEYLELVPILKTASKIKSKVIPIPQKIQQSFFTNVFPNMMKTGKVELSEKVEELMVKNQLITRIYLDSVGNQITARVLFNYGDSIINPFQKDKKVIDTSKIVLREPQKEEEILNFFEELEFKVKNSEIYLDDHEQIFSLITDKINKLQGMAEVYYSEAFNKIKVKEHLPWVGGIRLREDDLLEFTFEMEGISNKEIIEVLQALEEKKKYYRLKDGSLLKLDMKGLGEFKDLIRNLALKDSEIEGGGVKLPKYQGLLLEELLEKKENIKKDNTFQKYINLIKSPESWDFQIPETTDRLMRQYQKKGFHWIKTFATFGLGGILADDMGLGKTLQMISAILSDKEEGVKVPSLVVVPSSLLRNWYEEVEKFAPQIKTLVIFGTPTERENMIKSIENYDLIITSYPLIQKDVEKYRHITFNYYILDEAQHIKNPISKNAKAVKEINSKSRFALTGTPIENTLTELWSLFDFILPNYLGSYSKFKEKFETPILKSQDPSAYSNLTKHVKPFILRRMKTEVLQELPPKIEQVVYADMTREQKKVYLATLGKIRGEIDAELKNNGLQKSHIKILAGLTRLRQVCCHPSLFIEDYYSDSGKFTLLMDIIKDRVEEGHRILLFSQFTSMLKIISHSLEQQKIEYKYLDGSTDVKNRGGIIKEFNEGKGEIFLISLKTGGTGLNLTSADIVIHYDPWWNPAVEDQATDRAYRIGQQKAVHVMKLITKGTIEEKIIALQDKKKKLIDSVIQPGETLISKLTEAEIRTIFDIAP